MTKATITKIISVTFLAISLQSCGTSPAQRAVDQKVAAEPTVKDQKELAQKTDDLISSAPGLTETQKADLNNLRTTARSQAEQIQQQSLKLREVLVKDLLASDYNSRNDREIQTIKTKISKLETDRLNLTFDTIDKAQKILGHEAKNNQIMMNHFLERDIDGRWNY